MDRVGQKNNASCNTAIPKRKRNCTFALFFGNDPLNYKPCPEGGLPNKTDNQPMGCAH